MRETHSNAVEEVVLLLRQQRELIESTGKKEVDGKRMAKQHDGTANAGGAEDVHTHVCACTHTDAG